MNALSVFQFEACQVRTIMINGDPWFVAKDIAEALGYVDTDQAIRKHCKRASTCPVEMTGQVRQAKIIPEGDMFRLIVKSQLPSAEKFESWVMDEVLPSIRRTGSYNMAASPFQRPEVEATGVFDAFLVLGKKMGFDDNMAAFSANHATTKIINVNVLELMGVTKLITPKQVADFEPRKLGEHMNPPCSAIKVNEMLVRLGYQVRTKVKQCPYEPTEKGKPFCRLHDVPRTNSAGTSQQLRWYGFSPVDDRGIVFERQFFGDRNSRFSVFDYAAILNCTTNALHIACAAIVRLGKAKIFNSDPRTIRLQSVVMTTVFVLAFGFSNYNGHTSKNVFFS